MEPQLPLMILLIFISTQNVALLSRVHSLVARSISDSSNLLPLTDCLLLVCIGGASAVQLYDLTADQVGELLEPACHFILINGNGQLQWK